MRKYLIPLVIILIILTGYFLSFEVDAESSLTSCTGSCTTKEIGRANFNSTRDSFTAVSQVSVGQDWWVKLTAQPRTGTNSTTQTVYPGADIMLVWDTTGSMNANLADNVTRFNATKNAIQSFLNNTDVTGANRGFDYIGLATFSMCSSYNNSVPISWIYQEKSPQKIYGALMRPLTRMDGAARSSMNSLVDSISLNGNMVNFCNSWPGNATDTGAGLTIANTQLTNLFSPDSLNDAGIGSTLRSYRTDSRGNVNNGPAYRGNTTGVNVPKFMVLLSDGEENTDPRAFSLEIDGDATRVEKAKQAGVKIYTVLLGDVNNRSARNLLSDIASEGSGVDGKSFYIINSNQDLTELYDAIRSEISATTVTETQTEIAKVGFDEILSPTISNYFELPTSPSYLNDFRIYTGIGGDERNLVECASLSACGITLNGTNGFTYTPPANFRSDKGIELWFKLQTKGSVLVGAQIDVPVDDVSSKVVYNTESILLAQKNVELVGVKPYFQSRGGGNIYSRGAVQNNLFVGLNLFSDSNRNNSGIFRTGETTEVALNEARQNRGVIAPSPGGRWVQSNRSPGNFSYADMFEKFSKYLVETFDSLNGVGGSQLNGKASGFYAISGNAVLSSNLLVGDNSYVVFVDGDLEIKRNVVIGKSGSGVGKRGLIFIVKGNLTIDPAVTEVDGYYIVDNVIKTGSSDKQLVVQGGMMSNGGIALERLGKTDNGLAEEFVFRPDLFLAAMNYVGEVGYVWKEVE